MLKGISNVLEIHTPMISNYSYASISGRLAAFITDTAAVAILICTFLFVAMGESPPEFNASGDVGRPSLMDKYQFFAYFEPMALDAHRNIYFKNFIKRYTLKAFMGFGIVPMVYFVLFEGLWGATIGKLIIGIRVRKLNGQKINFGIAFLRHIGRIISTFLFLLGYALALNDSRKQTLHDKMAKTIVLNIE